MRAYSGKTSCESPDQSGLSYKYSYYKGQICGADNNTYADIFALRNASLRRGIEIRIGYMGPCRGKNKYCLLFFLHFVCIQAFGVYMYSECFDVHLPV